MSVKITEVIVDAQPGSYIDDCILDCIQISYNHKSDIRLRHNGVSYMINFIDVSSLIIQISESGVKR